MMRHNPASGDLVFIRDARACYSRVKLSHILCTLGRSAKDTVYGLVCSPDASLFENVSHSEE